LSPDPIDYPLCIEPYNYANGDPINFTDPDGRFASHAYDVTKVKTLDMIASPRFQGGMQAFAGLSEAGATLTGRIS
ncbi:MAG: hypothetical protein P0S95_07090, partial [Rhabdochlamydiaceae bacterium]|nr:hypothetical protein [Candidatus Amphrikana amoebophyrae]